MNNFSDIYECKNNIGNAVAHTNNGDDSKQNDRVTKNINCIIMMPQYSFCYILG